MCICPFNVEITYERSDAMPRIPKCRRVCAEPKHKFFKSDTLLNEEVILCVEELESIRLTDFENLDQDVAAERMSISRGTFQRILYSARHKVAEALVMGKSIAIDGGNYEVSKKLCEASKRCKHCCFSKKQEE